ncbi:MAG: deoxyribodipyrimidine photo-lyase [Pseudomonadota bacterium]
MSSMTERLQIVWFKRDLRIADNAVLHLAAEVGPVLPLYIAEPEFWALPDSSARQWVFVAECLVELQHDLRRIGSDLVVRTGDTLYALNALKGQLGAFDLWSHEETGNGWTYQRDQRVASWCKENRVVWREFQPAGVIRKLDTRDKWAAAWDRRMAIGQVVGPQSLPPIPIAPRGMPSTSDLGLQADPCPGRQKGGRSEGLRSLESFLSKRGQTYQRAMSSPLEGEHACSRISPHLAWGSLSTKEVAQACWSRQAEVKAEGIRQWGGAMRAFNARLHWRCHFMQKLEDEPQIEFNEMHPATSALMRCSDAERLNAWALGETGLPFVDASMRFLRATGWMNFRMRAMLVSVASYHLWLDWRESGRILASYFTDFEPGIHWSQVQMQSGTTGINSIRIYNPVKQGHDQDPKGAFIRRWVPELTNVPDACIHEPWQWNQAATVLGKTYPEPIVDYKTAAKSARNRVYAMRNDPEFKERAKAIVQKHASRSRPIRRHRTQIKPTTQMSFDL